MRFKSFHEVNDDVKKLMAKVKQSTILFWILALICVSSVFTIFNFFSDPSITRFIGVVLNALIIWFSYNQYIIVKKQEVSVINDAFYDDLFIKYQQEVQK